MLQTREDTTRYVKKNRSIAQDSGFDLLSSMSNLNGFELEALKVKFDQKYEKLAKRDSNFMLHDFVDDYYYIVYMENGEDHYFCKGKQAYDAYKYSGTKIVRKTKDLFPSYTTLIEKDKEYKNKMDKADYDREYDKKYRKQIKFVLNRNTDQDVIEYLEQQENKSKYLKDLIRKDMEK